MSQIGDDILGLRDLWKRYQELSEQIASESTGNPEFDAGDWHEEIEEQRVLAELFTEVGEPNSYGEFEEPTLILDSYFEQYARDFAEEVGAIDESGCWPAYCIDWAWAARELQMDYGSIEINGYTYWQRS